MLDMYADDAVFDVSAVFTDVAPMERRAAIRSYWQTLRETWAAISAAESSVAEPA